MKAFSLTELASRMGGVAVGEATVTGFATDSNRVGPGDLFIAIRGARVDGHAFTVKAVESGAVACLVERPIDGPHILVSDVVTALASFGLSLRKEFAGPVVGITGSAGKTTTKEFVGAALSPLGPVVKTAGNRNTEYTSPLLWAEVMPDTAAVVVELAMRGFGQIAHLAAVSLPQIGVVTNIGYSHMLQVGSRAGIAKAKGELLEALPQDGWAVLPADDEFLPELLRLAGDRKVLTFGWSETADVHVTSSKALTWDASEVEGTYRGENWKTQLPAVGRHIATNAAAAMATAIAAGVAVPNAAYAIRSAQLPPMRMETRELNGGVVFVDTYNASPPSMLAAIETLAELPVQGRRLAIIGEMKELGDLTAEAHHNIGSALVKNGIEEVIFVGEAAVLSHQSAIGAGANSEKYRISTDRDDQRAFLRTVGNGDVVLMKGSRALELERALEGLE